MSIAKLVFHVTGLASIVIASGFFLGAHSIVALKGVFTAVEFNPVITHVELAFPAAWSFVYAVYLVACYVWRISGK